MVRDFIYGAIVGGVLGCSSETMPALDGGQDGPTIGPDVGAVDAPQDVLEATSGQDGGVVKDAADERVWCGQFIGVIPDADPPVACTGSNWSIDDLNGTPVGACQTVSCPSEQNRYCTWNGVKGYVCCPGHACQ